MSNLTAQEIWNGVLERKDNDQKAINYLFENVMFGASDKATLNELLTFVDLSQISLSVAISFLTCTFKYSSEIPNHVIYFEKVKKKMEESGESEERIENCLQGLKDDSTYK